jgi:glucose-6-phosphate isomerase
MKLISYNYRHTARITSEELVAAASAIKPEIVTLRESLEKKYETDYALCALPGDAELLERVQAVVEAKQRLNPSALVVIGIGGSIVGTQAVLEALYGCYYNEQQPKCKIYFVDTFDTDASYDVYLLVEQLLQEEKTVLVNIVSKSGSTLETQTNSALFVDLVKRYRPLDYKELLVITTDHDSVLWRSAQRDGVVCLEIPKNVGGRFSVLSAVGLFPLGLIGVDLVQLRAGAATMLTECLRTDVEHNPAALSAALLNLHYYRGAVIHDTFLFSKDLAGLGVWYRQLMAESLGKMYDRSGGLVRVGMLPTVSIGSTDLHSVGQLYLAGPHNRFTTFVTVQKNRSNLVVPIFYNTSTESNFQDVFAGDSSVRDSSVSEQSFKDTVLNERSFDDLMNACAQGTMISYQKQELPFTHSVLPEKSAWYVGQFLQMKMIEILYFGYLLDVNPFDQPQVELYKQEMRKLLDHA